ncbi:hypothetical protein AQUCO_03400079v1 [Aquilegia coerulea]|uniref:DUF760 domain-containing protein n=1 Tax=Aquilegia coerulea TaxID=218851 RepID=A0A2G5CYE3_AQUCA|nr:hypothetical protein AQUCO_03400079v1 [Aquilegia coerulea]
MDCCASIIEALPIVVKSQRRGAHFSLAFSSSSRKSILQSQNILKLFVTPESDRNISAKRRNQSLIVAIANAESRAYNFSGVGTPHEPSSPEGKFLSGILQNQRHLFRFALSEQLDELASNKKEAVSHEEQSSSSLETLLHRIAEMKEKECQSAVEDVIYMSIVHKFSEIEVPMVPKLSSCISNNKLEIWPSKCRDLESVHSFEVQKLIREHLDTILRFRGKSSGKDGPTSTKIDRLHLGRIYAASIMYGYFLKSASFRHQLEAGLAQTQRNLQPLGHETYLPVAEYPNGFTNLFTLDQSTETQLTSLRQESLNCEMRPERLSNYVKEFDSETLQRCAKLKSKEVVNVIEKHTWALFGDEDIDDLDCDNDIAITCLSLERLVLEAVTFGSFLWDVERSVDSVYGLKEN